jgi:hypothetical protein
MQHLSNISNTLNTSLHVQSQLYIREAGNYFFVNA